MPFNRSGLFGCPETDAKKTQRIRGTVEYTLNCGTQYKSLYNQPTGSFLLINNKIPPLTPFGRDDRGGWVQSRRIRCMAMNNRPKHAEFRGFLLKRRSKQTSLVKDIDRFNENHEQYKHVCLSGILKSRSSMATTAQSTTRHFHSACS